MIEKVKQIVGRISMSCFGSEFKLRVDYDNEFNLNNRARVFIQVAYDAPCTKTGENKEWHGRKWYLSKHMTDDEIVKTAYVAFESCIKHEVMEGFKVDGIVLFNPHVNFEELLQVSNREISRLHKQAVSVPIKLT